MRTYDAVSENGNYLFRGLKSKLGRACRELMETAYALTEAFGMDEEGRVVYDNRRNLWTSQQMRLQQVCIGWRHRTTWWRVF